MTPVQRSAFFNLKMAVELRKEMQDFELESLPRGGDHSQKVKAPPLGRDSSSKGCVYLPDPTAVFRFNRPPGFTVQSTQHKIANIVEDALLNPFFRIPITVILGISSLVPDFCLRFLKTKDLVVISKKNIPRHRAFLEKNLPAELSSPSKRQFKSLLKCTEKLRKQIIPNQKVTLYTSPKRISTSVIGNKISLTSAPLFLDITDIKRPKAELKEILAHELAHLRKNHNLQNFLFSLTTLLIDLVAFMLFPPLILAVEGGSSLLWSRLSKHKERVADQLAMKYLNTNKGAVSYWKKQIKKLKTIKYGSDKKALKCIDPRVRKLYLNDKKLQALRERISKKGNMRFNVTHPKETERLKQALRFSRR